MHNTKYIIHPYLEHDGYSDIGKQRLHVQLEDLLAELEGGHLPDKLVAQQLVLHRTLRRALFKDGN